MKKINCKLLSIKLNWDSDGEWSNRYKGGSRAVGGAVLNYLSRKEVVGSKVNRGSFMMSNNFKKKSTKTIIITSG